MNENIQQQKYEYKNKEMFHLMMQSIHFIYGYVALDHMVKDHSDNEREPTAATTWATVSD